MLRCASRLSDERLELSTGMRTRLRRLMTQNAAATTAANAGTFLWFVSILGVYSRWWGMWFFFTAYAVDNALHTLCAFFLSGLLEAVRGNSQDDHEATVCLESSSETHSSVDVLEQLKHAGKMAGSGTCSAEAD